MYLHPSLALSAWFHNLAEGADRGTYATPSYDEEDSRELRSADQSVLEWRDTHYSRCGRL